MSGISIGDTPVTGIYYGSTPITSVYKGSTKIWPTGLAKCLRFNGTSQLAYVSDPAFATATVGSFGIWVRPQALLADTGNYPIATLNVSEAGDNSYLSLNQRYNSGYGDTDNHFDVSYRTPNADRTYSVSSPDAMAVDTWVLVGADSDPHVWYDGSLQTHPIYRNANHWTSGWWGNIAGAGHDLSFGALYMGGVASSYAQIDIGHNRAINRVLTSTEWAEWAALGPTGNPSTLSFASDFNGGYNLDGSLASIVSGEDLTAIDSPAYVDI